MATLYDHIEPEDTWDLDRLGRVLCRLGKKTVELAYHRGPAGQGGFYWITWEENGQRFSGHGSTPTLAADAAVAAATLNRGRTDPAPQEAAACAA